MFSQTNKGDYEERLNNHTGSSPTPTPQSFSLPFHTRSTSNGRSSPAMIEQSKTSGNVLKQSTSDEQACASYSTLVFRPRKPDVKASARHTTRLSAIINTGTTNSGRANIDGRRRSAVTRLDHGRIVKPIAVSNRPLTSQVAYHGPDQLEGSITPFARTYTVTHSSSVAPPRHEYNAVEESDWIKSRPMGVYDEKWNLFVPKKIPEKFNHSLM